MTTIDQTRLWSMLDALLADDGDRMNHWEVAFIDDLNTIRRRRRERNNMVQDRRKTFEAELSEKQADTLERIWLKVFG